jgi:cell division protein FtsW
MVTETKNSSLADGIAMVVVLLMAIGTVFVFSASANLVQELDLRHFYNFPGLRQILFFPLAVAIMYIVSCFNYRRLAVVGSWFKSLPSYLLVFSTALLIIVLFPKIGIEVNNARRWLRIPAGPISISFQPSELAKWSLLIFLAAFCDKYSAELTLYRKRFIPACLIIGLVAALIITQDFGTAAFVSLLSFLILIIAGVKLWHIATLAPFAAVAFAAVLIRSPGRLQRISAFLNPDGHASSAAYQANQSLIALGSGGLLGKGLGEGICKYGHLPEDTTDFVFSIVGEELGLVGTATVILLFIIFVWLGILVVMRCRDRFGQLLAGGIVMAVAIQAALNIGVVTVVLPTKGIPLPFVSAGGTSMLLSSAAVGLLLNIAKQLPKLTLKEKLQ